MNKPGVGHNSGESDKGISQQRLKSFVERIERLEEEEKNLKTDKKEVYSELNGEGFDAKIVRQAVRRRKMNKADIEKQEAILALYLDALGDLASTPLGRSAVSRAGG